MFIDANVFIYAYAALDEKGRRSKELLRKISIGEQHATTSALVLNEIFYYFMENEGLPAVEEIRRHIGSLPFLIILPIDNNTANASMEYMRQGLQVTDAFHAATMKIAGISTICSYDKHFDSVKSIKRQQP